MAQLLETEGINFFQLPLLTLVLPVLLIIIILKTQLKSYYLSSNYHSPPLPPGPTPWPIVGNIPHLKGSNPHLTLTKFSKTYGPLFSLKLGSKCLIVGSSPEAAIEILKKKDQVLSGRHAPHALPIPTSESMGWMNCNDNWKYLRTLCKSELFSNKALEAQASLREKNITQLVNFMRAKEGEVVKIGELVSATVFNMLGNVLMSREFVRFEDEKKNEDFDHGGLKGVMRGYIEMLGAPNLVDCYPILSKLDIQGIRKKAIDFRNGIKAVWEPIIEERKRSRRNNYSSGRDKDFLDILLDNGFSNNQINQLFVELFAAGTDTTSSTIEWAMAELLRHPESMKKVHLEIEGEIDKNFPNNSTNLPMQLPYLQACIKETLRLYPPAPLMLPHRALETCQVMNYTIPKDAQVMINLWAIGRDPSIWEEPLKFKPKRFLKSNIDFKGNDFEFIPFGAGRRICPGLPMAAKTIPLILVSLIHFFDWSRKDPCSELNMNEKFGLTIQMEHPLQLIPKLRK